MKFCKTFNTFLWCICFENKNKAQTKKWHILKKLIIFLFSLRSKYWNGVCVCVVYVGMQSFVCSSTPYCRLPSILPDVSWVWFLFFVSFSVKNRNSFCQKCVLSDENLASVVCWRRNRIHCYNCRIMKKDGYKIDTFHRCKYLINQLSKLPGTIIALVCGQLLNNKHLCWQLLWYSTSIVVFNYQLPNFRIGMSTIGRHERSIIK